MSYEDHFKVVKHVAEVVKGRCHVVPGTAQPSTEDTIKYQESAKKAGATASLTATPYFNKPSQEGMFQHYSALSKVGLPIVIYNVPGRTNGFATPATLQRIYEANPEVNPRALATTHLSVATYRAPYTIPQLPSTSAPLWRSSSPLPSSLSSASSPPPLSSGHRCQRGHCQHGHCHRNPHALRRRAHRPLR